MSEMNEINTMVYGLLTDEFQQKSDLFRKCEVLGIKPIEVNQALKNMNEEGSVKMKNEGNKILVRVASHEEMVEASEIPEIGGLKKAPQADRVRAVLEITEEEAEGLSLLNLRTPPVKKDLVYPEGVTKEMYNEFKERILSKENKSLLWDLVSNFNGAGYTAITMWNPEHEEASEDGKVFYQWNNPEMTWDLMVQLCKILDLYSAQEAQKVEVATEE